MIRQKIKVKMNTLCYGGSNRMKCGIKMDKERRLLAVKTCFQTLMSMKSVLDGLSMRRFSDFLHEADFSNSIFKK
jgi:hypothetical protein